MARRHRHTHTVHAPAKQMSSSDQPSTSVDVSDGSMALPPQPQLPSSSTMADGPFPPNPLLQQPVASDAEAIPNEVNTVGDLHIRPDFDYVLGPNDVPPRTRVTTTPSWTTPRPSHPKPWRTHLLQQYRWSRLRKTTLSCS